MTQGRRFPDLEVRSLDGTVLRLPGDLPGPADLLVLAFRRRQQADVDGWRAAVAEAPDLDGLGFWEVPVLSRAFAPVRSWIDGGMTQAIGDAGIRAHTVTAYTEVGRVCRALGIDGSRAVVPVLVVDGLVRWQGRGPVYDQELAGLRAGYAALDA